MAAVVVNGIRSMGNVKHITNVVGAFMLGVVQMVPFFTWMTSRVELLLRFVLM